MQENGATSTRAPIVEGPKVGTCNICGTYGPLTLDHTPPKGAVTIRPVRLRSVVGELADSKPELPASRVLQNGVRYRSLCANCNNSILGAKYDPSYIDFVKHLRAYVETPIEVPEIVHIAFERNRSF